MHFRFAATVRLCFSWDFKSGQVAILAAKGRMEYGLG